MDSPIIYGKPNERPSPLNLKGKVFVDYVTPAQYLSLGNEWVLLTSNVVSPDIYAYANNNS